MPYIIRITKCVKVAVGSPTSAKKTTSALSSVGLHAIDECRMTEPAEVEFRIPTVGRAAFMGQLYNARKDQLINKNAFPNAKEISVTNSETKVTYTDVSLFSERARALNIQGELS